MSTTITGSQNINTDMLLYRNSRQEEKYIGRRPINGNVSMEVSPSKGTFPIGTSQEKLSFSAEYNKDSIDSSELSNTTLSYKYARWEVFGGAYSSEKIYKNFLGGVLHSKLGTFTSEIHTGDQYSLGYSTEGTWIGDLLAQQLDFRLTKSDKTLTYSGRFEIGPFLNNITGDTKILFIKDGGTFNLNTITMLGWRINERNIVGTTFEVSADRRVHSLFYEGSLYEASYGNLFFKPSIRFKDDKDGGVQFAVSLLTRFQAKP